MEDREANIACASGCGWDMDPACARRWGSRQAWCASPDGEMVIKHGTDFPDFGSDLNAINAAVLLLSGTFYINANGSQWNQKCEFNVQLERIIYRDNPEKKELCYFEIINASARQRREAYLRTIGKWVNLVTEDTNANAIQA